MQLYYCCSLQTTTSSVVDMVMRADASRHAQSITIPYCTFRRFIFAVSGANMKESHFVWTDGCQTISNVALARLLSMRTVP
jgi:hypothetical protein